MKYTLLLLGLFGCQGADMAPHSALMSLPEAAAEAADPITADCVCSAEYIEWGLWCALNGDMDGDCRCNGDDNCPAVSNCGQPDGDADNIGDACDILPNLPDPEATIAALDTRLDALEAAGTPAAIASLQYDIAALSAALAEIRTKYPEHYHGLLGLAGDPVGNNGDLNYDLPNDP